MKLRFGSRATRTVGGLALVSVLLNLYSSRRPDTVQMTVALPVQPVQWALTSAAASLARLPFLGSGLSQPDAAALHQEIADLRARVAQLEELLADAQARLDSLGAGMPPGVRTVAVARVIAADASDWRRTLIVDRGWNAGVPVDAIAVWNGVLIGRVVGVGPKACRVRLLTDPDATVAVRSERTRAHGIVKGTGSRLCRLKFVDYQEDIRADDVLVTAGTDGIFPPHYVVGRCARSAAVAGELERQIDVTPWLSAGQVETVELVVWTPPDTTIPAAPPTRSKTP